MTSHLALVPLLTSEFPRWLDYFVQHGPFTKPEQLAHHLKAIEPRRRHASVVSAAKDDIFLKALHNTLKAWGLGVRRSALVSMAEFGPALFTASSALAPLETLRIDASDLDVDNTIDAIWRPATRFALPRGAPRGK